MIKLYNAKILQNAESPIIDGEIVIEDNKIVFVGEKSNIKCETEIDCNKNLLMPGFINCHAHSPMVLLKGLGEGKNLESWLFDYIIPRESNLTAKDCYNGTKLAIKEFFKNGITCFQEQYFYPEETFKACSEEGIRCVIALWHETNKTTKQLEDTYNKFAGKNDLINFCFYCHSVYRTNEQQFFDCINLAKKYNTILTAHASETLTEVGECTAKHGGLTPIMLMDSYGFFDVKTLLAHGVYLEKEDLEILKNKDVSIAHNPSSNLKLGSGIANLKAMNENNINVCLGTDGSASNNKLDMFREMYLSSVLQKGLFKDSSMVNSVQALQMATENGAKALNIKNLGRLEKNFLADIILIDLHSINNQVCNDIKSNLVYSCGTEDVLMTICNGKIVYKR